MSLTWCNGGWAARPDKSPSKQGEASLSCILQETCAQSLIIAETLELHHQCYLTNVSFPFCNIYHHSGRIFIY